MIESDKEVQIDDDLTLVEHPKAVSTRPSKRAKSRVKKRESDGDSEKLDKELVSHIGRLTDHIVS